MTPARGRVALLVAAGVTAVAWVLLDTWRARGGGAPPVPWTVLPVVLAVAAAVLVAGWEVRRTVRGRSRRPVDPLTAARVAVLAKAAAYGGAALTGWYAAQVLLLLPDLTGGRSGRLGAPAAATAAAVLLAVAGLLAQRWCRVPPDRPDGPGAAQPSG